ncbi:MAG: spermidine/putrescine ABC transporter ATP-binding protein PotA [Desulfobacterales bacterium]|nr:spermidine/putrescine ABC transporter ATP-binding protein PotA [Desulfobacterales bacterium]
MKTPIVRLKGVTKRFREDIAVDRLTFHVYPGEFLTLLGPSGCGKTTILRLIAGFEEADEGDIIINGQRVNGMPANRRDVNTVFQNYALFPHMTVFDNISFALRMKKIPLVQIHERVGPVLQAVKLEGLEKRRVHQLSGGQQQRVAVARAIVNEPLVLLLDEPFSALDYKLRKQMQLEMKRLHRKLGITFIFVTHDQSEAISMSDRIIVMNQGSIEQIGTPQEIYEEPDNLFVARFVGEINVLDAQVVTADGNRMTGKVEGVDFELANRRGYEPNQRVKVLLRPEDLVVTKQDDGCQAPYLKGRVEELIYKGTTVDLIIRLKSGKTLFAAEFFNEDAEEIIYKPNEPVCISWYRGWEVVLPDD